ncbi:interleukin-6 receptor subunit alpha [Triplophysa dalaica]|uniref:interleukin-6 receptor subunit alpha n=1 Tax=Triplophysa dalaica TaxID=1582913 RepID=UPI0024DFFE3B|nr:interleukin-6 receptor subunit alpha [Triplophysa dalaica]
MWSRSTLKLLVFVLSAMKVHCYREGDELCPRKEPPPGVLVLQIGSNVVLGCRGDVTVNDVPLVLATVVHKKHRNRSEVVNGGFTTQSDSVYVEDNSIHQIKASATTGTNTKTVDSRMYTEPKENTTVTVKPSVTIREDRPPSRRVLRDVDRPTQSDGAGGARQEKAYAVTMGTNSFSEEDEYDDYDYEEESSRVTRGIKKRTWWTRNGQQVRVGVERGGILRLPHLSLANAGNYSCYRGDRWISTTNITVGASPERPTIICSRKTQTSKVRCDWTSKEPITPRPLCYLLLRYSGNVTRTPCSFFSSRCWCAFPVEEGDKTLHKAILCVTNTLGSATSPQISFTPQEILKPDPPTKVEVRPVEGRNNILKVSWSYPRNWKIGYYFLDFYLRYRPQQAEKYQIEWIKETLHRRLSFTISDALPHTKYEIQIQAKEEFDGHYSDWTDTVFGMTWSNNDIYIAPETTTSFESNSLEMFSEGSEGSGEGPGLDSVVIVGADDSDKVWLCVSAVCGLCCFAALMILTLYFFRHRLRFMSTLGKESLLFSFLPRSSPPLPPPVLSVQLPEEGNSLLSPINHNQQRFLPDQQEEQEGIHLHNIDYFLTPATEGVPLTISSSLQDT